MIVSEEKAALEIEIANSGLFYGEWYLRRYLDVAKAGIDPLDHYIEFGAREGRSPNPFFEGSWYSEKYLDGDILVNPLLHYLREGCTNSFSALDHSAHFEYQLVDEKVCSLANLLHLYKTVWDSYLFEEGWYLEQNQDVAAAGVDPLSHFMMFGHKEERWPNRFFDTAWYSGSYDLKTEYSNPLLHYIFLGANRGYSTSADWSFSRLPGNHNRKRCQNITLLGEFIYSMQLIDQSFLLERDWYYDQYPNVAASGGDPLLHYLAHGVDEMRNPNRMFDTRWYLAQYPEVAEAGINPLAHYIGKGAKNGYNPHPFFPIDDYKDFSSNAHAPYSTPLEHFLTEVIARAPSKVPQFTIYDVFRLADERANQNKVPAFIRHINTMVFRPRFLVIIIGSDPNKIDYTLSSLSLQIYKDFSHMSLQSMTSLHVFEAKPDSYVILLNAGDTLFPHALYRLASELNRSPHLDFIYYDHEEVSTLSRPRPCHKPDWSPDLLESFNYIKTAGCYKVSILSERVCQSGCNYELLLRVTETDPSIAHIDEVLSGIDMLIFTSSETHEKERAALEGRLLRTRRQGRPVAITGVPNGFSLHLMLPSMPLVSIIIPTASRIIEYNGTQIDLIANCVESIVTRSSYGNIEIVIVDNGDLDTSRIISSDCLTIRYISYLEPEFDMARKMNMGAFAAKGEFLITFNDDIVIISPNWIEAMLAHFEKPHVGMVGARLLYPDNTLQHVGMVMSDGHMHHVMSGLPASDQGYGHAAVMARDCLAVTGAAAMIRKSLFVDLEGYANIFPIDYNDTDLCFKARDAGYTIVLEPRAEMFHFHAVSARRVERPNDLPLFWKRWAGFNVDPYHNQYVFDRHPPLTYNARYSNRNI